MPRATAGQKERLVPMKWLAASGIAWLVLFGLAPPVHAQEGFDVNVIVRGDIGPVTGSSSDTFLSFSSPVGIPGVGLAPGTYIFRTVTPSVMQVLDEDRSTVYAMFFVTPVSRTDVTNDDPVELRRIEDDAPPRIVAVFPPAASRGYRLMYPEAVG
jgi:hypothetical protein